MLNSNLPCNWEILISPGNMSGGSDIPADSDKGQPVASPAKTAETKKKSGSGVAVGDYFLRTEEEMVEFALKLSLEESAPLVRPSDGVEGNNSQVNDRGNLLLEEFNCPICAEVNIFTQLQEYTIPWSDRCSPSQVIRVTISREGK